SGPAIADDAGRPEPNSIPGRRARIRATRLSRPGDGTRPGVADRDHAPLPAGHRTAAVARPGDGLAPAPRPRRRAVAQRSRPPAGRSPDTTTVGRGPGRALQRTQHRPRSATSS